MALTTPPAAFERVHGLSLMLMHHATLAIVRAEYGDLIGARSHRAEINRLNEQIDAEWEKIADTCFEF